MRYLKPTFISLIFHLCLMLFMVSHIDQNKGKEESNGGRNKKHGTHSNRNAANKDKDTKITNIKIIEKSNNNDIKDKEKLLSDKESAIKKLKQDLQEKIPDDCKVFYNGIGIESNTLCIVSDVYKGYPAYENGIQVGDMIVSPPCYQITGPEGTRIDITLMRNTQMIKLSFKRGKICGKKST